MSPRLVALDWGTSSCRAYLLDGAGDVVATRATADGVLAVGARARGRDVDRRLVFEETLAALCGDWLRADPAVPVLASGMVGSDRGWVETPYLPVPLDLLRTPLPLTAAPTALADVHVLPGVATTGPGAGVMRGEETQALGLLLRSDALVEDAGVVVLPGTHSKWLSIRGGTLTDFATAMTGELYAVLLEHSILGRGTSVAPATPRWDAFDRGLDAAWARDVGGLALALFGARSHVLTASLAPDDVPDYLSGLLVGAELGGVLDGWLDAPHRAPVVVGAPSLTARYSRALRRRGLEARTTAGDEAARGLFHVAVQAGLVERPARRAHP